MTVIRTAAIQFSFFFVCVCVCVIIMNYITERLHKHTCSVSVGLFCLNKTSQTSSVPLMLVEKNTPGLVGLQHASVRGLALYLVHMIGDSLASSDHNWRGSERVQCT